MLYQYREGLAFETAEFSLIYPPPAILLLRREGPILLLRRNVDLWSIVICGADGTDISIG